MPGDMSGLRFEAVIDQEVQEVQEVLDRITGRAPSGDQHIKRHSGMHIALPRDMPLEAAIQFLSAKLDEKQGVEFRRKFDFRPWDGAAAAAHVINEEFGGYAIQSGESMFGGRIPASKITVPTSLTETVAVPFGGFMVIAGLPGCIAEMNGAQTTHGVHFYMSVLGPPELEDRINHLFERVEGRLKDASIYRGKAFDGAGMPNFLDLSVVDTTKVVYAEEVLAQLEANIWSLMRYPEACTELGLPTKRAVLFEGPYGTGKTLAAYLTAREAIESGWTFVYCRPQDKIEDALHTARLYEPAVVFCEDIDAIAQVGEKDAMSRLLDTFDGIENKNTRILLVVTTNHVGQIHKGMLRPGRLDAVISIGALDRPGLEKLITAAVRRNFLEEELDFDRLYAAADGMMPAFVREGIERAVRYAIVRNEGVCETLTTEDFEHAFEGMRDQLAIMEAAVDAHDVPSLEQALTPILEDIVHETVFDLVVPIYADNCISEAYVPGGLLHEEMVQRYANVTSDVPEDDKF